MYPTAQRKREWPFAQSRVEISHKRPIARPTDLSGHIVEFLPEMIMLLRGIKAVVLSQTTYHRSDPGHKPIVFPRRQIIGSRFTADIVPVTYHRQMQSITLRCKKRYQRDIFDSGVMASQYIRRGGQCIRYRGAPEQG